MRFPVEQILNLPGMKVLSFQSIDGLGLIIEIEAAINYCTCPKCGLISRSIHQNHWRTVHDLPWNTKQVLLRINRRQFKCKSCRSPFSEELDFIDKQRGYTKRFAANIIRQVLDSNIHSVAVRNDLSDEEVQSMLNSQSSSILKIDLTQLKRLGIDEIALVKGQGNYLAVLVDLDTHLLLEVVKSRRISELRLVFERWGSDILEQITEVSIDLWSPYKSLVQELMPDADVTADRFHVMKQVNDELDAARKAEKKEALQLKNKADSEPVLAGLTSSKYSLIKNEDDLTETQKDKLKLVKNISPILSKMHALKEEFRDIF